MTNNRDPDAQIRELIRVFEGERSTELRGVFASIFILQNRLQTIFDNTDECLTLKQFMLLTMIRFAGEETTLTHLGSLLGSSRQNVKKLADNLERKGFIAIGHESGNRRRTSIRLTAKAKDYVRTVAELHSRKLEELFSDYSESDIHMFYRLITRLYGGVEREERLS